MSAIFERECSNSITNIEVGALVEDFSERGRSLDKKTDEVWKTACVALGPYFIFYYKFSNLNLSP